MQLVRPADLLPGGIQPGEEWEEAGEDAGQPPDLLYLEVCSLVRRGKRREKMLVSLLISYTWRYAACMVRSGKRREKILVSLLISYTWRYAAW